LQNIGTLDGNPFVSSAAYRLFGGIVGVVKDPGQSAVAGAELTLTNLDDHTERKAGMDGNGGLLKVLT